MLSDFQNALAELAASPAACRALRADTRWLDERYTLAAHERRRLLSLLHDGAIARAQMLYRVQRLAPLAIHFDATLGALGKAMRPLLADYWAEHARGLAHPQLEAERFARWLDRRLPAGAPARTPLEREAAKVQEALAVSLLATEAIA